MSEHCLVGFCMMTIAAIIVPLTLVWEIVQLPISIPLYLYRQHMYSKWLNEWTATLNLVEMAAVERYIQGPINLTELRKYSLSPFQVRFDNYMENVPKYIPQIFIQSLHSIFIPFESHDKFILALAHMLEKILMVRNNEPHHKRIKGALIKESPMCPICHGEDMNLENTVLLDCAHVFHADCIREALKVKSNCPCCREEV